MTVVRVIDFETTGTEPPEAQVCEVGYCDVEIEACVIRPPQSWLCGVIRCRPMFAPFITSAFWTASQSLHLIRQHWTMTMFLPLLRTTSSLKESSFRLPSQ